MMKHMSKVMKCSPWATHSNSAFSPARAWTSPSCRATTRGGTGEKYGERQSKKYWEKVHFKGNARKESQEEFLMICGTHLERRDGEQALLGLPSCSAEIDNIHLSWKYDKSLWLIGFVTWHAYSPLSTGCTFLRVNSVPFARCTSRSSLYTLVDIWLSKWLPCTLIINVALIISPIRLMHTFTMERWWFHCVWCWSIPYL